MIRVALVLLGMLAGESIAADDGFDVSVSCDGYYQYEKKGVHSYDTVISAPKGKMLETTVIFEDGSIFFFYPEKSEGILDVKGHTILMNSCTVRVG